jgi:hypothetical protein
MADRVRCLCYSFIWRSHFGDIVTVVWVDRSVDRPVIDIHRELSRLYAVHLVREGDGPVLIEAAPDAVWRWAAAAQTFLSVTRQARLDLLAEYRRAGRWWRRCWPPHRIGSRAAWVERAGVRYRARVASATVAYTPIRDRVHALVNEELDRG